MKNYFSFNLTGKKLFPIWLLYLLLFLAPYTLLVFKMQNIQAENASSLLFFPLIILFIIIAYAIMYYIAKLAIEHVALNEKSVVFKGSFGGYFGTVIIGFFLSIITLGIYLAWFMRNIHSFFVDNSTYDSSAFKFKGKGGKLFVILLISFFVPVVILSIALYMIGNFAQAPSIMIIQQVVMMIILIPYMYLVYKWLIDIDYKDFHISWKTNFWNSCGKIAIEVILTMITLGIYWPMAVVKLYKYFAERTTAQSDVRQLQFGYDIDPMSDFLFIWGQTLLTVITLGIYYPWAFSKIGSRILGKTYLEEK